MKLATYNYHVNGNCWSGFQDQRSTVKVIARSNAIFRLRDKDYLTASRLSSAR